MEAIKVIPCPQTIRDVRSLMGKFNYCRKMIPKFATIAKPILDVLKGLSKDIVHNTKIQITQEIKDAIDNLKQMLMSKPILSYPNWKDLSQNPFNLYTVASSEGLGCIVTQMQTNEQGKLSEKLILYDSERTNNAQQNHDPNRLELLCLLWSCESDRHLLFPNRFTWYTDNISLSAIHKMEPSKQICRRWLATISPFNFDIKHMAGTNMRHVDYLSREAITQKPQEEDEEADEMPLRINTILQPT